MNNFEYATPENVKEAIQYLGPKTALKAGGVDLLDLMKEGLTSPKRLVNIRYLGELNFKKRDDQGRLLLGPTLTLGELAEENFLPLNYRALSQAAGGAATPQIRNVATLVGNICQRPRCWYFRNQEFDCLRKGGHRCFALEGENQHHAIFDTHQGCVIVHPSATAVALMALEAKITIVSPEKTRTLSLEEFFVRPAKDMTRENILKDNEVVTEIQLPMFPTGFSSFYDKQKAKQSFDWPIAEVAVALQMEGNICRKSRVILGAAAPTPWRSKEAEAVLLNQPFSKALAQKAAEAAMKPAQPLSQNAYKVKVFKTSIARTLCWAAGVNPLE